MLFTKDLSKITILALFIFIFFTSTNLLGKMNQTESDNNYSVRVNSGGLSYTSTDSVEWLGDQAYVSGSWGYIGGDIWETTDEISNTSEDALYQSERWGLDSYRFTVPSAGFYRVDLHFAEIYLESSNERIFDVFIEGNLAIDDLDIYSEVGHDVAYIESFNVEVIDGVLDIEFSKNVEDPKISAIEVISIDSRLNLTIPNGGEVFTSNTTETISWLTEGDISNINLDYSQDNGENWIVIENNIPNSGSYSWLVPDISSVNCLLRITNSTDVNILDISDNVFTINDGGVPQLNVSSEKLDYAKILTSLNLEITNNGGGILSWEVQEFPNDGWILINGDKNGSLGNGQSAVIQIDVNRSIVSDGRHYGEILITTNAGIQYVDVILDVGTYPTSPELHVEPYLLDFTTNINTLEFLIKNRGIDIINWSVTEDKNWITSISPSSGSISSMEEVQVQVNVDHSLMNDGIYTGLIDINTNAGNTNVEVELVNGDRSSTIRANVGGHTYTDSNSNIFSTDRPYHEGSWGYVRGHFDNTSNSISNTTDDYLYQTGLFWLDGYKFDIENGNYTVILHFVEVYYDYVGGRIFDVSIEDQLVLDQFDIYSDVGFLTATARTFSGITVTDGRLDIDFKHHKAHAKISAIEVIPETNNPELSVSPIYLDYGSFNTTHSFTITNVGNGLLDWSAVENPEINWMTSLNPATGSLAGGESETIIVNVDRNGMTDGSYTGTISVTSNSGDQDVSINMAVSSTLTYIQRVNCGSDANYTDANSDIWSADKIYLAGSWGYVGGNSYQTDDPIDNTTDDPLYQSERWEMSAYHFDVPNGDYNVILHFAEIYYNDSGIRMFDVLIEGNKLLDDYDIFSEVGHDVATTKAYQINIIDGCLDIEFETNKDATKVSAIEVKAIPIEPVLSITPINLDFGLINNSLSFTVTNIGNGLLDWSAAENPEVNWITSLNPASGSLAGGESENVNVIIERSEMVDGNYEGTIDVTSNGGNQYVTIKMSVSSTITYTQRVNCGSDDIYIDLDGDIWSTDQAYVEASWGYIGGDIISVSDAISGTEDDYLYQTVRSNMDSYCFTVPISGRYQIDLHFAEIIFTRSKQRVFDVNIEGNLLLDNLDVYKESGHDAAYIRTFEVDVADGVLDIDFISSRKKPIINAIMVSFLGQDEESPIISNIEVGDILSSSAKITWNTDEPSDSQVEYGLDSNYGQSTPLETPLILSHSIVLSSLLSDTTYHFRVKSRDSSGNLAISENMTFRTLDETGSYIKRINAGGDNYTDTNKENWLADQVFTDGSWGYIGGEIINVTDAISGTEDDYLYQTARSALQSYCFTVPVYGRYKVDLHFAEISLTRSKQRIFDVNIEGNLLLDNLDVYKESGHDAAYIRTFEVDVSDGILDIDFIRSRKQPIICAIMVSLINSSLDKDNSLEREQVVTQKLPMDFYLSQNYPNPFNLNTEIRFQISGPDQVVIKVFNTVGKEIRLIVDQQFDAGVYYVRWDGKDELGNTVPTGTYYYRLQVGNKIQIKKMMLLK